MYYNKKQRNIIKVERNGKYSYQKENGYLISSVWFDYAYNFNEKIGLGKVVLNGKYNFLSIEGILVAEWKVIDKNTKHGPAYLGFYPSKNSTYQIPSYLYRISRLENLDSIIDLGVLSRDLSKKYLNFENNSYEHIQERRSQFGRYNLHEYAPLFFSKFPPMMYSTKVKENIANQIIIIFDGNLMLQDKVAYSDVSLAYTDVTEDNIFNDLDYLKKIDFSIFKKKGWENDVLVRKKKGAEVLIKKRIDFKDAKKIIYFDESKKEHIESILKNKGYNIPITYNNYENYK